jgi:hypothetical protein
VKQSKSRFSGEFTDKTCYIKMDDHIRWFRGSEVDRYSYQWILEFKSPNWEQTVSTLVLL